MDILHLIVLAIVQGITEFLPISSSAHLILVPAIAGWEDQGLVIDVALHIGTLAAVLLYFRRDVAAMTSGGMAALGGRWTPDGRLAVQVIAATVPVVIVGFLLKDQVESDFRSAAIIAVTTILFGLLLWAGDRRADGNRGTVATLAWSAALLIGLAQAVALVPGVSRSGITMTAALLLGLTRTDSARFSLLLSIPTTAAAGLLGGIDIAESGDSALQTEALVAAILAFLSAYAAIAWLMRFLQTKTFLPFVIYRMVLGMALIALIAAGTLAG